MMTPKQTALARVATLIATALVCGFLTNAAFTYFTLAQIGIGFCAGMLAYLIKMVYDIELSKAETLERLNK